MNKEYLLSIIVPVYNLEKYIARCIDSLLEQGLTPNEYEIIIIDDGSTDNSLSICRNYEKQHQNITVRSQSNKGPGLARNLGLDLAQGEYIYMVDGDDYLIPNGLSFICGNFIHLHDFDLITFGYTIVKKYVCYGKPEGEIVYEGQAWDFILKYGILPSSGYSFFVKKVFLEKYHLRFSNYMINEDILFTFSLLLLNPFILRLSCNFYRYVIHDNSICTTRERIHNRKCINDHISSVKEMYGLLEKYQLEKYNSNLFRQYTKMFNYLTFYMYKKILCAGYDIKEYKQIVSEFVSLQLLPLGVIGSGIKCRVSRFVINMMMKFPITYKPVCFLYNKIFVKYILTIKNKIYA